MEGQADTPMPGGEPQRPPHQPTRQAPFLASAMRAARGLPPGVPEEGEGEAPPQEPPQQPPGAPGGYGPPPSPAGGERHPGRPQDPLSVPFVLPSTGVHYPEYGHQNTIYISPTRGAQEEVLAGIQGGSGARLKVLMHVTKQCFQTGNIPFDKLLLDDWVAAILHFLSYSAGSDVLALRPTHTACGASFPATMRLGDLPLVIIKLAEEGETPNWPPKTTEDEDLDEELRILREMEQEEEAASQTDDESKPGEQSSHNVEVRILAPHDAQEPFSAHLPNGDTVRFRLARVDDLVKSEEFSERIGSSRPEPGTKLHTFLLARHIVSINGEKYSPTRAYQWVKQQPSPVLGSLREQVNARTCGYDTAPRFRCRNCGVSFKVRLPLDGSLFRRPTRKR